jgi:hypothetical protein
MCGINNSGHTYDEYLVLFTKSSTTICIAVTWTIWLARQFVYTAGLMKGNCMEIIKLWANRSKKAERREAIRELMGN